MKKKFKKIEHQSMSELHYDYKTLENRIKTNIRRYIWYFIIAGIITFPIAFQIQNNQSSEENWILTIPIIIGVLIPIFISWIGDALLFTIELTKVYREFYEKVYHRDSEKEEEQDNTTIHSIGNHKNSRYLQILNLHENCTKQEIKKQYRKLAKQYHPDVIHNKSEYNIKNALVKMQEINEAYEYLMSCY